MTTQDLMYTGNFLLLDVREVDNEKYFVIYNIAKDITTLVDEENLIKVILNGATFRNLTVEDGKLIGINGSISRYISKEGKVNERIIILEQQVEGDTVVAYKIVNRTGKVFVYTTEKLMQLINTLYNKGVEFPVANGKIVDNHISAIQNTYKKTELLSEKDIARKPEIKPVSAIDSEPKEVKKLSENDLYTEAVHSICKKMTEYYSYDIGAAQLCYFKQFTNLKTFEQIKEKLINCGWTADRLADNDARISVERKSRYKVSIGLTVNKQTYILE